MYSICVSGHGNFPEGIDSAITTLTGKKQDIKKFCLNKDITHEEFEQQVSSYLDENKKVIVFTDITGGSPHQVISKLIFAKNNSRQYIFSGISVALILDIIMRIEVGMITDENIENLLEDILQDAKNSMCLLHLNQQIEDEVYEDIL